MKLSKGDIVTVEGKVGTYRVENITEFHVGLVSLAAEPGTGGDTGIHLAVTTDKVTSVGHQGTGADPTATPASGAAVTNVGW